MIRILLVRSRDREINLWTYIQMEITQIQEINQHTLVIEEVQPLILYKNSYNN
jgi:hypothetical protein